MGKLMKSNDEDLGLFLKEFTKLLNKYHYKISPYQLWKITDNIAICGFRGDGDQSGSLITPEYFEPVGENLKHALEDGILDKDDYEK